MGNPTQQPHRVRGAGRMGDQEISTLLGQPALVQLIDKADTGKNEKEKKELRKKVETQCKSFDGKGKLTVDDYYSVLKVQCKVDVTKNDIRKVVADLPMDKNYKISIQDFCRTPILSDEVFKSMDKNNDGKLSMGELKLARKDLTMKQIQSIMSKLDDDGNGTISLDELKKSNPPPSEG